MPDSPSESGSLASESSDPYSPGLLQAHDDSGSPFSFTTLAQTIELSTQIEQLSPAALAYLGDAVYELYIRVQHIMPPKRLRTYHEQVVRHVRAEAQADHLKTLQPQLTAIELDVLRRGRNAASGKPKRVEPEIYQQATGLEALLGYLYLTNPARLIQLLQQLHLDSPLEG